MNTEQDSPTVDVYAVFEGGGVRGTAFAGAIAALEEQGVRFRAVAGASAGAIVASLLAAGYSAQEMKQILLETNFKDFKDSITPIPYLRNVWVWRKLGFHKGKKFGRWIEEKLSLKLLGTPHGSPRFEDLPTQLKVIATDVAHGDVEIFDRESTPRAYIAEAVRMSMSIPYFFCPVQVADGLYVDGGVSSNFPAWAFEKERISHPLPVLGLRLQPKMKPREDINNLWQFTKALINTMMKTNLSLQLLHREGLRIILLPTGEIGSTDFEISMEQKLRLYEDGYDTTLADLQDVPIVAST
jgi:NTE family protein